MTVSAGSSVQHQHKLVNSVPDANHIDDYMYMTRLKVKCLDLSLFADNNLVIFDSRLRREQDCYEAAHTFLLWLAVHHAFP